MAAQTQSVMNAYIAFCFLVCIAGYIVSTLAYMTGVPSYVCNFVYGVIIAVYAMENWTLLRDLNEMSKKNPDKVACLEYHDKHELEKIMSALFVRIDVLTKENALLRESHKKEKIKRRIEIHAHSDNSFFTRTQSAHESIILLKDSWMHKHRSTSI